MLPLLLDKNFFTFDPADFTPIANKIFSKIVYNFTSTQHIAFIQGLHWCAKIKDEVKKLAYQLNEEAERTERPIRRLSKVMYGSTCAGRRNGGVSE